MWEASLHPNHVNETGMEIAYFTSLHMCTWLMMFAGLEKLVHLEWLCLAGNGITVSPLCVCACAVSLLQSMEGLDTNIKISHLDLSDNS